MNDQNARGAASATGRGCSRKTASPSQPGRGHPVSPLTAAIFAVLYPASLTLAQGARTDSAQLEEIVVTATRRDVNLQEVPQSITAISTEVIEKQALRRRRLSRRPAVRQHRRGMPGRNTIVMRGIATGSAEYRTDSQVSVYLDEQPMTSISQQADVRLIDIERVEALPGPQGTLFGSSSQAGTIRYITNKPDVERRSRASSTLEVGTTKGGDESYDFSGWVNIPVNDNFALRAVGYWSQEGGYVDNVVGPDVGGRCDQCRHREEEPEHYTTKGGRSTV